jgi:hypothetical protein
MALDINRQAWLEEEEANEKGLTILGDRGSLIEALQAFDIISGEIMEDLLDEHSTRLKEAKEYDIGRYRVILSGPHSTKGQEHAHVKLKNGCQIWSVNKNGTGHDGYHGLRMQKSLINF